MLPRRCSKWWGRVVVLFLCHDPVTPWEKCWYIAFAHAEAAYCCMCTNLIALSRGMVPFYLFWIGEAVCCWMCHDSYRTVRSVLLYLFAQVVRQSAIGYVIIQSHHRMEGCRTCQGYCSCIRFVHDESINICHGRRVAGRFEISINSKDLHFRSPTVCGRW